VESSRVEMGAWLGVVEVVGVVGEVGVVGVVEVVPRIDKPWATA
jgi:hypothetical protein